MAIELELKYAVDDLHLLDCMLCDPMVCSKMTEPNYRYIQMETTYYDTESGSLSARKWTFRLRRENERSVITLKTPAEGRARNEWQVEQAYLEDAVEPLIAQGAPAELRELLAEDPPVMVCGARFTRITAVLQLDGARCEICGDIGHLLGAGRQASLCELELELIDGSEDALYAYGRALAEKYALREQPLSKYARARALAKQGL